MAAEATDIAAAIYELQQGLVGTQPPLSALPVVQAADDSPDTKEAIAGVYVAPDSTLPLLSLPLHHHHHRYSRSVRRTRWCPSPPQPPIAGVYVVPVHVCVAVCCEGNAFVVCNDGMLGV